MADNFKFETQPVSMTQYELALRVVDEGWQTVNFLRFSFKEKYTVPLLARALDMLSAEDRAQVFKEGTKPESTEPLRSYEELERQIHDLNTECFRATRDLTALREAITMCLPGIQEDLSGSDRFLQIVQSAGRQLKKLDAERLDYGEDIPLRELRKKIEELEADKREKLDRSIAGLADSIELRSQLAELTKERDDLQEALDGVHERLEEARRVLTPTFTLRGGPDT